MQMILMIIPHTERGTSQSPKVQPLANTTTRICMSTAAKEMLHKTHAKHVCVHMQMCMCDLVHHYNGNKTGRRRTTRRRKAIKLSTPVHQHLRPVPGLSQSPQPFWLKCYTHLIATFQAFSREMLQHSAASLLNS